MNAGQSAHGETANKSSSATASVPYGYTAQLARFLLVGALNTAFGYGVFALFILVGIRPAISLALATVLGVLFNFKSFGELVYGYGAARLLPRFLLFYLVQFLANLACMRALETVGVVPLVAQLIILPPMSLLSFFAMRRFVFRGPRI